MSRYFVEARTRSSNVQPERLGERLSKASAILKEFGFRGYKSAGQEKSVVSLLFGRDVMAILPTGGGKTMVAVLPCRVAGWPTLIISPLKALMQDQVNNLVKLGIRAASVSSAQTDSENSMVLREWASGEVEILLAAPERIHNKAFMNAMTARRPQLFVIDEAHVGSEWSNSFRPEYAQIGRLIDQLSPERVLALTATAPRCVVQDMQRLYGLKNSELVVDLERRDNLILSSRDLGHESHLVNYVRKATSPMIVYCATRAHVDRYHSKYSSLLPAGGVPYHGGMSEAARTANQNDFIRGNVDAVWATNAFGMGIDKSNIRSVIHADMPPSLENLSQEVGRAGRDGNPAECRLFYHDDAVRTQKFLIDMQYPPVNILERVGNYVRHATRDGQEVLYETGATIAQHLNEKATSVSSALGALDSIGILERVSDDSKQYTLHSFSDDPDPPAVIHAIKSAGMEDPTGRLVVPRSRLMAELGCRSNQTLHNQLDKLQESGWLSYERPYNGKGTKFSNLELFSSTEWKEIWTRKGEIALAKLRMVTEYHNTEDVDKHSYLEGYFSLSGL